MYKKYTVYLSIINMILLMAVCIAKGENALLSTAMSEKTVKDSVELVLIDEEYEALQDTQIVKNKVLADYDSTQRVIAFQTLKKDSFLQVSKEDYEVLLRIVEAEAGGEDAEGKMLVAGVILNRVESEQFPNTIKEVVFQKSNGVTQFSPVSDGKYEKVQVTKDTVVAVNEVLGGKDITQGALYFAARKYADPERMRWFDENLAYLFSHGGHEFFG